MLFTPSYSKVNAHTDLEVKKKANDNSREIEENNSRLTALEENFEQLSILTESLWSLLKEQSPLSDKALLNKVEETEELIKKSLKEKRRCTSCAKSIPVFKKVCFYCGEKLTLAKGTSSFTFL